MPASKMSLTASPASRMSVLLASGFLSFFDFFHMQTITDKLAATEQQAHTESSTTEKVIAGVAGDDILQSASD